MPSTAAPTTRRQGPALRDSLFLGFCAVLILVTKAALRLHLKVPGHSVFFLVFFLFLARACVPRRLSASSTALLAGLMSMALGMGKGGPVMLIKFVLPGLAVDLTALAVPTLFENYAACVLAAALAAGSRALGNYVENLLVGMEATIALQHTLIQAGGSLLFGIAGGLLVPPVVRKLKARGIVHGASRAR